MDIVMLVLGGICFIATVIFILFAGEKYMAWTIDRVHPEKYSLTRFKIVYATTLTLIGLNCIYAGFHPDYTFESIFFILIILMWVLFYTWCKKKESEK